MIERFEYRDTKNADGTANAQLTADQAANLIGQLVQHYDPSGLTETVKRDFKGNVLEVTRRLNNQPTESLIDWQGGFKVQVQRVNEGAVVHRPPGAWQRPDIFSGAC